LLCKQGAEKRSERRYYCWVTRALASLLVALAVAAVSACAGVDDDVVVDAAVAPDAQDAVKSADVRGPGCWDDPPFDQDFDPRRTDMLILLDRSGSMETAFGSGTRYQAISAVLSSVVQTYQSHVHFGFQEMPGRQGCAGASLASCCVSPPLVPVADGNADAIVGALAAAAPLAGNTPTAGALRAAREYYQSLDDGVDNRYVLLATDGDPNCDIAGALAPPIASNDNSSGCADAVTEVEALVGLGIRVVVLAMGQGLAGDLSGSTGCLDTLAHAGGAAASPGSPGFYATSDPADLELAIEQIFGGVTRPSCRIQLTQTPDRYSFWDEHLYLDGQEIDRDSWFWDYSQKPQPPSVVISGSDCDRIQHFEVSHIAVQFVCSGSSK
jgi:hypothetical protein